MAHEFVLPDIGEGLVDAEIVKWHVAVGDQVKTDQVIVEVETAKAVVEIPSPYAGTVLALGGAEGETIEVGSMLVVIGEPDEAGAAQASAPAPASEVESPEPAVTASAAVDAEPAPAAPNGEPAVPAAAPVGVETGLDHTALAATKPGGIQLPNRPKAMPIVRKMAREAGIDLAAVPGTGPDGAVTRSDLEAFLAHGTPAPTEAAPAAREAAGTIRRMSRTRRTIAEHMSRSWREIPHVTTFHEVDAARLLAARSALQARLGAPLPVETLIMKAVVPVLAEYPEFNATLHGDELELHDRYDLGVAVDTPDGLLVPVVRGVDRLGVAALAAAIVDLAARARDRKLSPDETTGSTFTVTNIGAIGGTHGTPIIPYGTTAILSVGRARPMPVARDGAVAVTQLLPLSLSFDHRVIDGALGQRFAARLVENLSEPALFLAT